MNAVAFVNEHFARANPISTEVYISSSLAYSLTMHAEPAARDFIAHLRFFVVKCNKDWVIISRD